MLFKYKVVDNTGVERKGEIEAINIDIAISSLQRRGYVVSSINPEEKKGILSGDINIFERVSSKDIVILSRQLSTLFEAQISALRIFRLLAVESPKKKLSQILQKIADDLQGGNSISNALEKHPKAFSTFYVSMVRSGEESGKLDQIFLYLADYLERSYAVTSRTRNALIYPAFVIVTFIIVLILMFTLVVPNISAILTESGQSLPIYTRIVVLISDILVNYGVIILFVFVILGYLIGRYVRTTDGRYAFDKLKISAPIIGGLFKKLYLARIADNLNTMLISAIPIVKSLEVTADVVQNAVYENILHETLDAVKSGNTLSDAFAKHKEIPAIMTQMVKVGEETGEMGDILKNLSKFYEREVVSAVDTLVSLIEPAMIVFLGAGVAILLASVLIPIYNISATV